jgi:hypothetical protein
MLILQRLQEKTSIDISIRAVLLRGSRRLRANRSVEMAKSAFLGHGDQPDVKN